MTMPPSFHCCANICTLLLIVSAIPKANAAVSCNSTHNPCEELLWKGSRCKDGYCTNAFQAGCLRSMLDGDEYAEKYGGAGGAGALRRRALNGQRVCNSEDPDPSPCRPVAADGYPEVRIFPQNWESAISTSWILQIILSELLDVPTTLETGVEDQNNNFYDEENRMDYGIALGTDDYNSFQNAFDAAGGDCRALKSDNDSGEGRGYVPCAHFSPEMWSAHDTLLVKLKMGVLEPTRFTGGVGVEGWFIPRFSVERDPSLDYYAGYQGEENRQKLANNFKRPTTWREYCSFVSSNNCSSDDGVATRAPKDDGSEDGRYFVEGGYLGYFRATDKNNCTKDPSCTGHFMDYPCDWVTFFQQQAHHLGVALESNGGGGNGGYTYSEMVEIWSAANATKSDVIGQWWKPDAIFTSFMGTDSELIKVTLPPPTKACIEARANQTLCDVPTLQQYGEAVGACEEEPIAIRKVVVGNLQSNIVQHKSHTAAMSPAYDFLQSFDMTDLQLDEILTMWSSRGIDKYNFDLRFVSCKWVADNLENIQSNFIPPSHPRAFVETSLQSDPVSIFAVLLNTMAIILTIIIASLIFETPWNHFTLKRSIRRKSQIEFVYLILLGLFMVPFGALVLACEPNYGTCISSVWFIGVGYTLIFVPTLVRISAIIRILQASRTFRRVTVDKKKMLKISLGISAITALFCALWTGLDPFKAEEELTTTNEENELGETIVRVSYYCKSNSDVWFWISTVWHSVLLIGASVLAFQMRSAPRSVNDSNMLAFMIYSSFVYLILHIILIAAADSLKPTRASLQAIKSILLGLDSLAILFIYFLQFFRKDGNNETGHTVISGLSTPNQSAHQGRSILASTNQSCLGTTDQPTHLGRSTLGSTNQPTCIEEE